MVFLVGLVSANQCNDGIDNDLDGDIDFPDDNGCSDEMDISESLVIGYAHGCLSYGQYLANVFGEINYQCWSTTCYVCVLMAESGNYTANFHKCDNLPYCGFGNNDGPEFDLDPPSLTVTLPINEMVYDNKRVPFEITVDSPSRIEYKSLGDTRWNKLCDRCTAYSRHVALSEGLNEITIRAKKKSNDLINETAYILRVDSKDPKIKKLEPKDGFTSGNFYIQFEELNPTELKLIYGPEEYPVDINTECVLDDKGKYYDCDFFVDLTAYDGGNIQVYAELTDIAGNVALSKVSYVDVDFSPPDINSFDLVVDGKYAYFTLDIDEPYLEEVTYFDYSDEKMKKEKKLCSKLKNGLCEKKVTFKDGDHNITIYVRDEAGNEELAFAEFFTDSKKPKIKKTYPKKNELATGTFEVEFDEDNPISLTLNYGQFGDMHEHEFDIATECVKDKKVYDCETFVNLTSYNGQEIVYYVVLVDKVNQTATSKELTVKVDTAFPVINSEGHTVDGRKAEVVLDITEENLDEVTYTNLQDNRPREKRFCSKLKDGKCEKRITLNDDFASNLIEIRVYDEAGHSIVKGFEILL